MSGQGHHQSIQSPPSHPDPHPSAPTTAPTSASESSPLPPLPYIHLLCMHTQYADAFTAAVIAPSPHSPFPYAYSIHSGSFSLLSPESATFDLLVSPANSYGLMDGGFDDAISRVLSPRGDYYAITRHVQRHLHARHRGYLPPGTAEIVPLPAEWNGEPPAAAAAVAERGVPGQWVEGEGEARLNRNVWGCRYLAVCPTMRVPTVIDWDREVVYECMWSLMCAVDRHNMGSEGRKIGSLLTTPLGTGVGRVTPQRWADQTVLALRHFAEARAVGTPWDALDWETVDRIDREVEGTWRGKV